MSRAPGQKFLLENGLERHFNNDAFLCVSL
jgi:hypothetical protein